MSYESPNIQCDGCGGHWASSQEYQLAKVEIGPKTLHFCEHCIPQIFEKLKDYMKEGR